MSPTAARSAIGTIWIASLRQAGVLEALDQAGMDRLRGMQRIRAAAQDHGIAGLEAERAGIGGDVRPAFIDDADDAERRAHALDMQAVRAIPLGDDLADGIGSSAIGADAIGHAANAVRTSVSRSMEGRGDSPVSRRVLQVERIGGEDVGPCGRRYRVGHATRAACLALGRTPWQAAGRRRGPGGRSRPSVRCDFSCFRRVVKHARRSSLHPSPASRPRSSPGRRGGPSRRGRHSRE